MGDYLYEDITKRIIGAAFSVHNALGKGLQEKAYENALAHKIRGLGLKVEQQKSLPVFFENVKVGDQQIDMLIEGVVLVEVKSVAAVSQNHVSQVLGYLKNTNIQLGLIINFGSKVEIKRLILTTQNK